MKVAFKRPDDDDDGDSDIPQPKALDNTIVGVTGAYSNLNPSAGYVHVDGLNTIGTSTVSYAPSIVPIQGVDISNRETIIALKRQLEESFDLTRKLQQALLDATVKGKL